MPKKTNFTANGSNYYRVTATVGKKSDGSPIRKQFYGESKKDAENKRDEHLSGIKQGLSLDYDKATFGDTFKHWLERIQRHSIGLSSYKRYESLYRLYIADCELSGMRLITVKSANIQGYYSTLLNKTTVNNIYQINKLLRKFFIHCVKSDVLIKNPLLAVELPIMPKQSEAINAALSDASIQKLVQACSDDIANFPFVFACFTGLRAGEAYVKQKLKNNENIFSYIDFKNRTCDIPSAVLSLAS
ncbi:MAG: hypothetical protein FWC75_06385 [Oscillospiraceae bacterium]|nr:hypothetical protein [Oscillospiraceae bacterium]